jgi:hypothetical protein
MFIERRSMVGRLEVISYGAYGKPTAHDTRRGGVAVVDKETKEVLAILVIAGSPVGRKREHIGLSRVADENHVLTMAQTRRYYFMPWKG